MRFLGYVLKNILVLSIVAVLVAVFFFLAMDVSNIYILINDGMEKRASVVLLKEDSGELEKFFTREFIDQDSLLKNNRYADYIVRSFDHKIKVEWMWTLPWSKTAKATVIEKVTRIDGELPKDMMDEKQKEENKKIPPPQWQNAKYNIILKKMDDTHTWKINQIQLVSIIEEDEEEDKDKLDTQNAQ